MRKFKLDKTTSTRLSALTMAGMLFISMAGCKNNNQVAEANPTTGIVLQYENENNLVRLTRDSIKELFPIMNDDVVNNASLVILLDELAKEDENGKINANVISTFKAKIDTDNMMSDFNSFLDTLEQTMIENKTLISVNDMTITKDKEILSKIESITSNIINGTKEEKKSNFMLIYTLFVNEDEITYDGLTFEVRDLSYSGRAIASAYARTSAYFAKDYIKEAEYSKIDDRTNNQNNKAYMKTKLEILSNEMNEKSLIDVNKVFNKEYEEAKSVFNGKVNVEEETIKNLVNYINLEYLESDKVSYKDKNAVLGEYTDEKVSNVLLTIDAINQYNTVNTNNIILFSNLLVDEYKETSTGELDKVALDYIQFNSIMLLNTTKKDSTKTEVFNNKYFQNIYKYFTKQNFKHSYKENKEIEVDYQGISDGAKLIANEIVIYTLKEVPNIFKYVGYEEKINTNLEETIQYVQNVITGECEKVEIEEFVKTK